MATRVSFFCRVGGLLLTLIGCASSRPELAWFDDTPPAEISARLGFWPGPNPVDVTPSNAVDGDGNGADSPPVDSTPVSSPLDAVPLVPEVEPEVSAEFDERKPQSLPDLTLREVFESVEASMPTLVALAQIKEKADAELLAARGGFDPRFRSAAKFKPRGFYENERVDTSIEQATPWWGSSFVGGYRLGTGDFPEYDEEDQTNSGGEFRAGVKIPLLQGGAIDERRLAIWRAEVGRFATDSEIRSRRIRLFRDAALRYWTWVAAGRRKDVASRLFQLALDRQAQLSGQVEEGLLPPMILVDNQRLIVEREAELVSKERGLQEAALSLSLFIRDEEGSPVIPSEERLPDAFPPPRPPVGEHLREDLNLARETRPEIRVLQYELERRQLDLAGLENRMLPKLNFEGFLSQDLGNSSSSPSDKSQFEIELGLNLEIPLGQRNVKGKIRATKAEIRKTEVDLQFLRERVEVEVRDAFSAWRQAFTRWDRARKSVELALQVEEGERELLREGGSDLLRVNLREQQSARDASDAIDAAVEYLQALVDYRAAVGVDFEPSLPL